MKTKRLAILLHLLISLAHLAVAQNNLADSLKAALRTATDDTARLNLYGRISWAYLAPRVELDLGRAYADSLQQLAVSTSNKRWKMRANFYYGAYERFMGNHQAATDYLTPYVQYYAALGDSNWVADGLFQLASVYTNMGDYPRSLAALYRIIAIDKSLGNQLSVAHSINSLGVALFNSNNNDEAIKAYKEALAIYDSLNNETSKAIVLLNLGNVYTALENYPAAKSHYHEALRINRKHGIQYGIALDLANIAFMFDGMHQYDSGLSYHLEALSIRETLPDQDDLAHSLVGAARGYRFTGNLRLAQAYFQKAADLSQLIGSKPVMQDAYEGLAGLYADEKDFEKAYTYLQLYKSVHDSLLNEIKSQQIGELGMRFETDKKNQQIVLLEKERTVQQQEAARASFQRKAWTVAAILIALVALVLVYTFRQKISHQRNMAAKNAELHHAAFRQQVTDLELKALKAQINPHFFFNCMNSINKLILEDDTDNASRYLTKFSRLVRSVLEHSDSDQITLQQELDTLRAYVQLEELRLKKTVAFDVTVGENIDPESTYLPPMILQPFIENAIWHGLMPDQVKSNGHIRVVIQAEGNNLHCTIEDNGVGRDKAKELQSNSVWKTRSMGMKITEERLRLLNKEKLKELIQVTDLKEMNMATGTRVDIHIPVS